jgi:hypothetical protein
MPTTVIKSIGATGRDYALPQSWETAAPSDLTLTRSNSAGSGSTTGNIVLDAGASGTNDFYTGHPVTCAGEQRLITAYVGSTKTATIGSLNGSSATWTSAPATSAAYSIDSVIWRGECYNDSAFSGGAFSTAILEMSGSTSSSTCYKECTTATGQSFRDHASVQTNALKFDSSLGVSFSFTGSYYWCVNVGEQYSRFSKIMLSSGTNNGSSCFASYETTRLEFVISEDLKGGSSPGGDCFNCLFINRVNAASGILSSGRVADMSMVNCTLVRPSNLTAASVGFNKSYNTVTLKNCAFFGVSATTSGSGTFNKTTCYTDCTSTGWTTVAYDTSTGSGFQNITDSTRDFRIKSTSGLIDVGTTDATNAPIDIAKTARPSGSAYDIGCWEYSFDVFIPRALRPIMQAIQGMF